jgi:DNA-binding response OmpR family regulator
MHADELAKMERQHIFIVNSSPDFLDIARDLLQEERYNVTTTNFVPDTFDQIEAITPSLLIVDVAVGDQAGWDLLERLGTTASVRDIPVIVVSTTSRYLDIVRKNPTRFAAQRLLQKPFNLDDLMRAVEELIGPA